MKLMLRVTTFAVAITIMLLIALAMDVASAEPPAKVKLNQDQTKEELNHSEEHRVVSNPSETISSPCSVTRSLWSIETVDSTRYAGMYTSIALDTNGYPHISYFYPKSGDLKYAKWTGSVWDIETVDSDGNVGYYTSIALDTNGYPHISYYDCTNENLKYAKWTGSVWDIETVDSDGYAGYYTSIALDSNNYPHISYYSGGYNNLKYAKWTGSIWSIEMLDPDARSACTSLALDTNDYPYISYQCSSPTPYPDLKYAKWTGSIWSLQVVDSLGDVGEYSSIALDTNGYQHISYYDRSYEALKYAYYISDIVTPPEIISHAPESPVNNYIGANRTFKITINQTVDVSWQINGTEVQTNASVTAASYTNTSAVNGTWNVSAVVSNANGTDMQTWVWTVTSPCFIATAAYGTSLHGDIDVLRDFRDEYLIPNPAGRAFVNIYYNTSPPLAEVIRDNAGLRTAVREGLVKPLVDITRILVE